MSPRGEAGDGQKYDIGELQANAGALFDVKPEVVAGALHGCGAVELTIGQVKTLIKKFIKRRVN
jgi:hypothetical protein